ncbi:MAG: phosphatidylglycerol lysyltransferase domain-containing protein, partial [Nitrospira sp.]|nr:phosphatidylglycerol lysyltransferase domain-containing protein [Nitrospira sp.]
RSLPQLTARVMRRPVSSPLRALTCADVPRFARALEQARVLGRDTPAAYAFPYHYIWTTQLSYRWMEFRDTLFVCAQSPDGWFMPLPPLGPDPLEDMAGKAFDLMRQWNGLSPVSRIENVTAFHKTVLERIGLQCRQKEGDYVYSAEALAALAGDRYKSQRALCNRVEREQTLAVEPYHERHRGGCLALLERWSRQKEAGLLDEMGALLLQDAEKAHGLVFAEYEQIGLSGTVAMAQNRVVAYTFGYWLTPQTWCVLLEVADRSIPGLAQWLFRETCRLAVAQGAVSINAMDDAGLPGLRAAKLAYHPTSIVESYVIAEAGT